MVPFAAEYEHRLQRVPIDHVDSDWAFQSLPEWVRERDASLLAKRIVDIAGSLVGIAIFAVLVIPLSLAILQINRGADLLKQQGEAPMDRFLEQLARSLQPIVRQNDVAVKYTSWSLAFVLPDTTLAGAQNLVDKLRKAAFGLRPP